MRPLLYLVVLVAVVVSIVAAMAPSVIEKQHNRIDRSIEWSVSERARALHDTLRVADLHADTRLWRRDFLAAGSRGHADLPRLVAGGVVLQVMGVVTKSPAGQNDERNAADARDNVTLLAIAQRWPPRTWGSLLERALYRAEKLRHFVDASDDLVLIRSAGELDRYLGRL